MQSERDRIRVLLAQFPLETHSRGLLTVAGMLRDAGMEVLLIGNALPEQIVETAVQENVDVIGISTYCGGEVVLAADLVRAAEASGIKNRTVFVLGGIFPHSSVPRLRDMGFTGIFPPSSTKDEIVSCITKAVASARQS